MEKYTATINVALNPYEPASPQLLKKHKVKIYSSALVAILTGPKDGLRAVLKKMFCTGNATHDQAILNTITTEY